MGFLTHIQNIELETHDGVVLLRGVTLAGDAIYAYVIAEKPDIENMFHACETGAPIDFSKYSRIIKHDWGVEPPDNVKRYMEDHYNFKHND